MRLLYSINIVLLGFSISIASLFSKKAKKWVRGRKSWEKTLAEQITKPVDIWMHCASLGEFDQGLPLLWEFKKHNPKSSILVSFFSPSGFEHYHKRHHCVDHVVYLPLDSPKNAKLFLKTIQPSMAIFIKYEFWLNYLFQLKKKGIPCYSVSTILRKNQIFFKWYGALFREGLRCFQYFYVQNQETKDLLASRHLNNVEITGDTRYDTVVANKALHLNEQQIIQHGFKALSKICKEQNVLILGSSWLEEEEIVHGCIHKLQFDKIIIAPHNISSKHLYELEALFGDKSIRLSEINNFKKEKVILIDSIGLLNRIYSLGSVAFIGGGFSGKLHNILEPAAYGLPVIFGPKFRKFPEAQEFISSGIGFVINNEEDLILIHQRILSNHSEISKKSIDFVLTKEGAAKKIIKHIFQ